MLHRTSDVWWKNSVIYCLDVETYKDSNGDGCGDFPGLVEKIDYLAGIGVDCLWLMPFYQSPQRDDGYDISDFYSLREDVGNLGDFTDFIRTANDRGIKVIADLVINHTSDEHPWFVDANSSRDSMYRDFYVWSNEKPDDHDEDLIFPGQEDSRWGYSKATDSYYLHSFYAHQPDLNFANPEVRDEVAKMLGFWLQQGLSGFRVDAVPFLVDADYLPEGADNNQYINELRNYVERRNGSAILLGEVNVAPKDQLQYFESEHGEQLHMIFNFPLNQALYLAAARRDPTPISKILSQMPDIPPEGSFANFIRNHDELSLDKLTDSERQEVFDAFGPEKEMQIFDRGLRRRLPPMLGGDQARLRMMYSLMFSLPGSPVLFYGEEIGMGENLDIEGRMSVRAPMQWEPGPKGGFSTADPAEFFRPMATGDYGPDEINVSEQRRDPDSLLNWMEKLIRERRECPEIGWGEWNIIDSIEAPALGMRYEWGDRVLVTIHNLSDRPAQVTLPVDGSAAPPHDLLVKRDYDAGDGNCDIDLEPYDLRWIRMSASGSH